MTTSEFIKAIVLFNTAYSFEKTTEKEQRKFLSSNLLMLKATGQSVPEYLNPDNLDDVAEEIANQINQAYERKYN